MPVVLDSNCVLHSDAEPLDSTRTFFTVAVEIAEVALQLDLGDREDPLLSTAAKLTALHNNLTRIGYYNKDFWHELVAYCDIMLLALSYHAKVAELDVDSTENE
ncbi:hypothetical protein CVT25_012526 [Psilocybe cyanescens]|uniref:PIN domain-containing protein n=1 Tax=Psilocybe cyanescens TaxID=93625 RepID=A0A409XSH7_PSICY|nr:hypothetical protein CVT25_012526 [Psilocybe cyanescens]